jgi:hypothetical protein
MGQKKIIVILGIISVILLAFRSANAQSVQYTKSGYVACPSWGDLDKIKTMLKEKDREAANSMMREGRCFVTKPDMMVYVVEYGPERIAGVFLRKEYDYEVKFRFQGSTETFWTNHRALSDRMGDGASEVTVKEWFVLKSFLWVEPGKTKKQEIIQKYGKPTSQDEDSILYNAVQHSDFKEWKTIKFTINESGVVDGIRAEK